MSSGSIGVNLKGEEELGWTDILFNAFDVSSFGELLLSINDRLDRYAGNGALPTMILAVVRSYNQNGTEKDLLAAAVRMRPRNPALARLANAGHTNSLPSRGTLESVIQQSNSELDFGIWLQRALTVQNNVCRIEIPLNTGDTAYGTGFLISNDLVMTNWHVVEPLEGTGPGVAAQARAKNVRCRFDYQVLSDGSKSEGTVFSLAPEWRVFWSPNNADNTEPSDEQLDCAVLRLSKPAGSLAVGPNPDGGGVQRGWIELPSEASSPLLPATPLFIVQHPQAEPVKLALDTSAITGVNAARNRVRYRTNTEPGSSGSPCFDQNWNLLALHHSGEDNYKPTWNEGIPMDKIVGLMKAQEIYI
jgi:hypothetical protein